MIDPLDRLLTDLRRRSRHDPADDPVRLAVRLRAREACEYCLLPTRGQFQVDHIIPPALWPVYLAGRLAVGPPPAGRGGPDHLDNYAWACPFCNQRKGQQVQGRLGRRSVRLFDPRRDEWPTHFVLVTRGLFIVGLDPIGQITVEMLGVNGNALDGPLAARALAIFDGAYPPLWARGWMVP